MADKKLWSVHFVFKQKVNESLFKTYGFIIIHIISTGISGIYWFIDLFLLYQFRFLHIL